LVAEKATVESFPVGEFVGDLGSPFTADSTNRLPLDRPIFVNFAVSFQPSAFVHILSVELSVEGIRDNLNFNHWLGSGSAQFAKEDLPGRSASTM
jgi:hypothetical protein